MKKRISAAAALLGLGACLENPGVNVDLANEHNRLKADFTVPGAADRVRIRLERTAGGTELYLRNLTDRPIDSLEFFAQVSDYASLLYSGGIGTGYPVFDDAPIAEFNGKIIGLQGSAEADLGPLTGAFPSKLDETGLIFIPLSEDTIGNHDGNRRIGYYSGVFTARDSAGAVIEGTLRGVVSYSGFHFWMRTVGHAWGALNGFMRGDSVSGIRYGDAVDNSLQNSTTLAVPLQARPDDSIGFAATLRGKAHPENPMNLRVTLSRSEPRRWDASLSGSSQAAPVPLQVRQ